MIELALALASTGISVIGSMQSAKAAKAQGKLQARQFANQAKDISESVSPSGQNQGQYEQLAAETRQMLRDKASTNPTQFS